MATHEPFNLGTYTEQQPFKYWCQKVLPLVYDDSLSYYELLAKVVDYINKLVADDNTLIAEVTELKNWFDNLDVSEEINAKLDEMAENGELYSMIEPYLDNLSEYIRTNAEQQQVYNERTREILFEENAKQIVYNRETRTMLQNMVGHPYTASTAEAMTDTDKVYVYTGTTTASLINGHWYFYDGTAWTDGGVYNSTALETDKTLLVDGAAADARYTGIRVNGITAPFSWTLNEEKYNLLTGASETIESPALHSYANTGKFKCTGFSGIAGFDRTYTDGCAVVLMWDDTTYIGVATRMGWFDTGNVSHTLDTVPYFNTCLIQVYADVWENDYSDSYTDAIRRNNHETDPELKTSGIAADAGAVKAELTQLKQDLGEYYHTFTMTNQYLATFVIPYAEKIYFKLISHPSATFAGVKIYGVSGTTETELTSGLFIHNEFYWSDIPSTYDSIKMTVGFGTQVSGEVTVILSDVSGTSLSAIMSQSALDIKDFLKDISKKRTGDLYEDVPFITGKNIASDFTKCNVDTYIDILQSSSAGSISAHAIKIRDDYGNLLTNIYFVMPTARANDNMCWTFDKNGNPIGAITGAHMNDGFGSNVYYIVIVNYWGLKTVKALYDPDKEYVFEVGSGKTYTSVSECLTRIAHVPYKKRIKIYAGTYDIYTEIGGDTFANAIASGTNWRDVSVVVENNTIIEGVGRVYLTMNPENINSTAAALLSPLNISGNVTVENINIECKNCRYGIHIEGSNLSAYNDTKCTLKNVNVTRNVGKEGSTFNGPAIGVGMNLRSKLSFENCIIDAKGGWAGLYFHENSTTLDYSPELTIVNSIFKITSGFALALSASANQTTMIDTYIASSYVKSLRKMTGGSSAFNDAYKIVMLNCNMPEITASDLMENEVAIEHYNTIA